MKLLRFIYDFIVGDDWTIAVAVVAAMGVIALVGASGWWVVIAALVVAIPFSLWRATRDQRNSRRMTSLSPDQT
jgi:Flp pilus assembly protein TadB